MPPESTGCLSLSIVDKYALQKHNLHLCKLGARNICLADFACLFTPVISCKNAGEDANEDALEELDLEGNVAGLVDVIPSGRLFEHKRYSKQKQEKRLRYVHYKLHDDAEAYYREQLLLYYLWKVEATDHVCLSADEDVYLLAGHVTFESRYESVKNDLEANRKRYKFNDRLLCGTRYSGPQKN